MNLQAFLSGYLNKEAKNGFVDHSRMAADTLEGGLQGGVEGFKSGGKFGLGAGAAAGASIAGLKKLLSEDDPEKRTATEYIKSMLKGGLYGAAAGGAIGAAGGAYAQGIQGASNAAINSMVRQADSK